MKKSDLFEIIKEANKISDKMEMLSIESKEYEELDKMLALLLDSLQFGYHPWYSLCYSNRTKHYYIRFH